MKQLSWKQAGKMRSEFGGSLLVGRRRAARPLCRKRPIHLVLKSSRLKERFNGLDFRTYRKMIAAVLGDQSKKFGIRILKASINSNHLHLAIRVQDRIQYRRFIRSVTATLVVRLSKVVGESLKGLWDLRPFTRVVNWGRSFEKLLSYIEMNRWQSGEIAPSTGWVSLHPR